MSVDGAVAIVVVTHNSADHVTDVIGAAVVGHWFTPQRRNIQLPAHPQRCRHVVGSAAWLQLIDEPQTLLCK